MVTKDKEQLKAVTNYFDFIINTVSAQLDLASYVNLLRRDGTMILLGVPTEAPATARLQPHRQAPPRGWLAHRRHRRNPGNAGLLRRAQHHVGHRND
ncbi:MAG: hypothetical protein WKG07_33135 [Hymenobacter sp.]